jgi:hypothetical protein
MEGAMVNGDKSLEVIFLHLYTYCDTTAVHVFNLKEMLYNISYAHTMHGDCTGVVYDDTHVWRIIVYADMCCMVNFYKVIHIYGKLLNKVEYDRLLVHIRGIIIDEAETVPTGYMK